MSWHSVASKVSSFLERWCFIIASVAEIQFLCITVSPGRRKISLTGDFDQDSTAQIT
jgi:hypothetical protein